MKTLVAMAVGTVSSLATGAAFAQNGSMMNGNPGMWSAGWMGGYGGIWVPVVLVIVVVGLVAWVARRNSK